LKNRFAVPPKMQVPNLDHLITTITAMKHIPAAARAAAPPLIE
jgi:hypothetical protein